MKTSHTEKQYTIRGVTPRMDALLREKSQHDRKSLNAIALAVLSRGLGLTEEKIQYHDLDDLIGTWVNDPSFDQAISDMDQIDEELWK